MRRDHRVHSDRAVILAEELRARLGDEFHPKYLRDLACALSVPKGGLPESFRKTMTAAEAEKALAAASALRRRAGGTA